MPLVAAIAILTLVLCALVLVRWFRARPDGWLGARYDSPGIAVGERVGDFVTSTIDGELLVPELLLGETLVAFFVADCGRCLRRLPKFTAHARRFPGGRRRVLVVLVSMDDSPPVAADLQAIARVVVEAPGGPLSVAFQFHTHPALLRVAPDSTGRLVVRATRADTDHRAAVAV